MKSLHMLDTATVGDLVRGDAPQLDRRVASMQPGQLCISAITRGELLYAMERREGPPTLAHLVDQLLRRVRCLPWDDAAARHFATLAATLRRLGTPIGGMDAQVMGHAIAADAVLVSSDGGALLEVPGLTIENWL